MSVGGDREAAEELHEWFSRRLQSLAVRRIRPGLKIRFDADGITQTVFRRCFRRLQNGEFQIDRTMSHLLAAITLNKIHKQCRRHTSQGREVVMDGLASQFSEHASTPIEHAAFSELLVDLQESVEPHEFKMLELCLQGHSTDTRVGSGPGLPAASV
ncbi:MAG: hypothetical protein VB861_01080, partial [Planctomycetaceae bacterium]